MKHPETSNNTIELVSILKYVVLEIEMVKIILILAELQVTGAGSPNAHPMHERKGLKQSRWLINGLRYFTSSIAVTRAQRS